MTAPSTLRQVLRRSVLLRALTGALVALAAAGLRGMAFPMLGDRAPFAFFYPAVVLAALFGGIPAGLGALLVGLAIALRSPPYGRLAEISGSDWTLVVVFTILSVFLVFAIDAFRKAREEAEEAKRRALRSERTLADTLRAAQIGHWTWEIETGRVTWSDNLEEIHGLPRGSFGGRFESYLELVHPEDRPLLQASVERAVREQADYDIDFRVLPPNGKVQWINGRGRALVEDGRVVGMTGLGTNVTARRSAVEARSRLAAIVDSSEDAIVSKDLSGRITSWNAAAERLFGYAAEEMLGESIEKLLPAERTEDFSSILSRIRRGERVEHYETVRKRKDGSTIELSLTVSPIVDDAGRIIGASKIARDLTARRQVERERERTRELLLGTLGHDLRNPLNTIAASAFYLQKRVPEPLQHVVARVTASSDRMVRLIDQLLDFARARLGSGIVPHLRAADLRTVVLGVVDEIEAQHPGRIRVTAADDLPGTWDPDRLAQVLSNLLGNALRHGTADDSVDLTLSREDGGVRIEVTNRGNPIPPNLHEVIFEPFRRAPSGNGQDQGGLGLGLYIAREIVRAHGGSIDVDSGDGRTTFRVRLPAAAAVPRQSRETAVHSRT